MGTKTTNYNWDIGTKGQFGWFPEWQGVWISVDTELYKRSKDLYMQGKVVYGSDATGGDLLLKSNTLSNGKIYFGQAYIDESKNGTFFIPTTIPSVSPGPLVVAGGNSIVFGYNHLTGFEVSIPGEPALAFIIEGYYKPASVTYMETYLQYLSGDYATNGIYRRMFFGTFDRDTELPVGWQFCGGVGGILFNINDGTGTGEEVVIGKHKMTLNSDGKLGIGCNPGYPLHVYKTGVQLTGDAYTIADFTDGTDNMYGVHIGYNNSTKNGLFLSRGAGGMGFEFWTYNGANWGTRVTIQNAGYVNLTLPLKINSVQVIGTRVIDARCDDAINSGDATTDGVIDSLRDAMIQHGLIAAA